MKKGQTYTGTVSLVSFPNKGHVQCEDGMAIVKNVIPGQIVTFAVNKKHGDRCEGRLISVDKESDIENNPDRCRHFGICGGCVYQSVNYDSQLSIKAGQVKELLDSVCNDYEFEGIKGSPVLNGYRNKMEFSFGDEYKDGPLSLGLHRRGSFHDIVTVSDCHIVDEDYRKILNASREYFASSGLPFYHKLLHEGYLRHLIVRKALRTGEIMIDLVAATQYSPDLSGFVDAMLSLKLDGTITGILNTHNDSLADAVQNDSTDILYGRDYIYEELLGLRFKITPFSFFQTNTPGAELLYEKVREYIGELGEKTVFDLYSGTGTIAQILAPVARKVVGVEIVEEAVIAARENAAYNGLKNCEFIAGDVMKVIADIGDKPDLIVLDPPRDGIHPKAIGPIIDFGVDRIVYVSCKPTSLARDLEIFKARGYRLVKACCVDMFPNTANVETVILLSQQKPDDRIEVEIELDELDLTSAESKATYKEIQEYVLEKYGLKVSNLYISQVKRKCGIEVGMNYNLPKSEDSRQPQCPEEKEKAIKDALEHFGMV